MAADVILSKLANAFVEDVALDETVPSPGGRADGVDGVDGVDAAREHLGGLWVGGRLTLTTDELTFRPNGLNESIHTGSLGIAIPLRAVEEVLDLPGVLTKVIGVRHDGRVDRFRTWGARKVAQRIRDAAGRHPRGEGDSPTIRP